MRLIALAQDREYEVSCAKCKALFAYKIEDLKVRAYPIVRYNWVGREIVTDKMKNHYYVICPNCGKWMEIIKTK